ncbi:hypothetical protein [Alteribacillus sp. YIM 98480]|nr:hypothetical protein [Alteribacillus sp. YIM 98480]
MDALHGASLIAERFDMRIEDVFSLDRKEAIEKVMILLDEIEKEGDS